MKSRLFLLLVLFALVVAGATIYLSYMHKLFICRCNFGRPFYSAEALRACGYPESPAEAVSHEKQGCITGSVEVLSGFITLLGCLGVLLGRKRQGFFFVSCGGFLGALVLIAHCSIFSFRVYPNPVTTTFGFVTGMGGCLTAFHHAFIMTIPNLLVGVLAAATALSYPGKGSKQGSLAVAGETQ